jgi:glycosyltransferase involved in cell wall biosynthesis
MTAARASSTQAVSVSIVIPAYNEEKRLGATLHAWLDFLAARPYTSEVIVVDDGSTDQTSALVRGMAPEWPQLRLHRQEPNRGKGLAVKTGVLLSEGARVFYVDADLNIAPDYVDEALLWFDKGYDAVIGTRSLADYARSERNLSRVAAGALFQIVRRIVTLPTIRDTQCGFKGFTHSAARQIFSKVTVSSFAFDVEALFLARKLRCRIKEMPVAIVYRPGSTVKWRRHLLPALKDIARVRANDLRSRYQ